ncbi:hypothetical protein DFH29DRAFT_423346 [Suillus ampliporus]|nr:hypothetical protein DFH29DRAFT_423346 [Suillus ampliporus]
MMFVRFTPVVLALLALAGVTTASVAPACQGSTTLECCENAEDAPTGWQGSPCTKVSAVSKCKYTALCCNIVEGSSAAKCYKASS